MYLEHFKFKELPFTLTPNIQFFCGLKGHQEALNTLLFAIQTGEGFIKIVGEVGSGKTLLCRKLLDSLGQEFVTAYIPNPHLSPAELYKAFARELAIDFISTPDALADPYMLQAMINRALLDIHAQGKRVVLLLDEAQALPEESLEALRLLTNLETEKSKLMQVVLFGQPELDERIKRPSLRQLKQRITFSYYLPMMSRQELDTYLIHRLATAGFTYGNLFNKKAKNALFRASKGIPRLVNILCHKALLVAFSKGKEEVTLAMMKCAIKDNEQIVWQRQSKWYYLWLLLGWGIFLGAILGFYVYKGIL